MDKPNSAKWPNSKRERARTHGRYIKAARELRGMSRRELGALLKKGGFHGQDPKRLEDGSKPLLVDEARALSRHLGLPVVWFYNPDAALRDPVETEHELEAMFRDAEQEGIAADQTAGESDDPPPA